MRTPTELVDELVRELLPSLQGYVIIAEIERRADEFGAVAYRAEPNSPHRVIALAVSDCLRKLHRSFDVAAPRT